MLRITFLGSSLLMAVGFSPISGVAQQTIASADPMTDTMPGTTPEAVPDAPSAVADGQAQAAQTPANSTSTSTSSGPVNDGGPKQTKRILGIIPNFRAVSSDQKLPAQSPKEKLLGTVQQSFDYSSFVLPIVLAAYGQEENSEPQFHQGAAGYGRYFWHSFADQTDENFWVQAFLPIALHQDSRYYTLGHGNIVKRAVYAFDRTLITRNDDGEETFNTSEIVGSGAASGLSDLYYPSADRTWTKTGQRWLTNVLIDGGVYIFQEFWPDINSAVFHQKD
jgi:hypothetical protein